MQEYPHVYVERRQRSDRLMYSFVEPNVQVVGTQERGRVFTTPLANGFVNEPKTDYAGLEGVADSDNAHDRFRSFMQYSNALEEFGPRHETTLTHAQRTHRIKK